MRYELWRFLYTISTVQTSGRAPDSVKLIAADSADTGLTAAFFDWLDTLPDDLAVDSIAAAQVPVKEVKAEAASTPEVEAVRTDSQDEDGDYTPVIVRLRIPSGWTLNAPSAVIPHEDEEHTPVVVRLRFPMEADADAESTSPTKRQCVESVTPSDTAAFSDS